jgi:hypothetical protein
MVPCNEGIFERFTDTSLDMLRSRLRLRWRSPKIIFPKKNFQVKFEILRLSGKDSTKHPLKRVPRDGTLLQRRLSLAEQLGVWGGCLPPPLTHTFMQLRCNVLTQGAIRDTINWLKTVNALFFLCCEMNSSHFLLNFRVFNWKLICTRHEFNSNNFILLHRIFWWEDWVSKLNSRLSFWGLINLWKTPVISLKLLCY